MAETATPGPVRLTVADVERQRDFYETAVGLEPLDSSDGAARLGSGDTPLVELDAGPEAPPRPPRTTGLFHLAIVVPTRADLARALHRVINSGWRLTGASDHLVSEALYLDDPEGNGIEIYRDRPRDQWRYENGKLQMATLPLDLEGVIGELEPGEHDAPKMAAGTRMGHVHLQVADIDAARAFDEGALGLDVTVDSYPGALFLSSGGYHHHIGLNTWAGEGAPPPPSGSRGLRRFEIQLSGDGQLDEAERRLADAGFDVARDNDGLRTADPSGNTILLKLA
ncbi:MAG: VOC family protein [Solirubrobacterales bacterium]